MIAKETHTNKTILRVIIAGVILLLAAGTLCGAASAYLVEINGIDIYHASNIDVHVGDPVTLTILWAKPLPFDTCTIMFNYFSGDHCFGDLPDPINIYSDRVPVILNTITTGSCIIELSTYSAGSSLYTPTITVLPKTRIEFYNGTTKIGEMTGKQKRPLDLPAAPTGTGTFFGWRVDSPAGDFFSLYQNSQHVFFMDSPYYDSSKNWIYTGPTLKLYAAWGEEAPMPASYTVTAAAGTGGSITDAPTNPAAAGDTVTLTAAAESGYHFKQWESISGLPFSTSTDNPLAFYMPNGPVSVTASFDADPTPAPSQTVIFLDANGGDSSTTNVTATKGSADLSGSITPPAKTGYTFTGFFTAKTDGECVIDTSGALQNSTAYTDADGNWASDANTITLYAQWTAALYSLTTAAGTGGTITPEPGESQAAFGQQVTLTATAGTGYHFKQWESISGLLFSTSTDNPLAFYMPNGPVSVTASFDADPTPAPSQTVIFLDANGGDSSTTNVTATKGSADLSGSITPPAKTGYTFTGFFTAKTDGECVIDTSGALQNSTAYTDADGNWASDANTITLYAQWTAALYSLTTAAGTGGTITPEPGESQSAFGQQITLTATAGTGSHFKQWTLTGLPGASAGDNPLIFTMPAQAVTVTAVFEEDTPVPIPTVHSITVQSSGKGSISASASGAIAGDTVVLAKIAGDGYQFKEWQVVPGTLIIGDDNTFTMPDEPVSVTAVFEIISKTVPAKQDGTAEIYSATVPFSGGGGASVITATNIGGDLTFKAESDTRDIPQRTGYTQTILSVFEIEVTSFKHPDQPSELTIDAELADESLKEYVCLEHYTGTAWEMILPKKRDNTGDSHTFRYVFDLTSYSPIGVVIEVPQSSPTPHTSSSSPGSSLWLTEPVAAEQPTVTPTPIPGPIETPEVKPVTPTGTAAKSPVPLAGVLAGLGAALAVFGLRRT